MLELDHFELRSRAAPGAVVFLADHELHVLRDNLFLRAALPEALRRDAHAERGAYTR